MAAVNRKFEKKRNIIYSVAHFIGLVVNFGVCSEWKKTLNSYPTQSCVLRMFHGEMSFLFSVAFKHMKWNNSNDFDFISNAMNRMNIQQWLIKKRKCCSNSFHISYHYHFRSAWYARAFDFAWWARKRITHQNLEIELFYRRRHAETIDSMLHAAPLLQGVVLLVIVPQHGSVL